MHHDAFTTGDDPAPSSGHHDPDHSAQPGRTPARNPLRRAGDWLDGVSLRGKLVGLLLALLVAALTVTGLGTQYVLHRYLLGKVDAQLIASSQDVPGVLRDATRGMGGDDDGRGGPLTSYVIQLSFDDGSPAQISAPANLPRPRLSTVTSTQAQAPLAQPHTVDSVSGRIQWRVIAVPAQFTSGQVGSVQIALPLDGVAGAVAQLRILVVLFGLLVTMICAALGWWAIRQAFRPLTEVEETAAAIAAGDLSRRVPNHARTTEVGRLTSALNGMLAQIESAFRSRQASEQRTRRFAADASHELRTPLASIRGFAELYRQGAVREPDDVARTMGRIEDEARRMGGLVEDLLLLARLDEQRPARTEPVDLAVLAGDAAHDARGLAPDRQVQLTGLTPGSGPAPAIVIGDDGRLRQVVANLVANAVRHTPAGTPIEIAVGPAGSLAVLEVRDHGPGLRSEDAAKVFERFYRVDSSRARGQGGGSGLGLSIVATVVAAHAGRVGVGATPGGGATFRVEVPLAPAEPDDAEDLDDDSR
jgi:two-component system OmpR family sensor kinase